MTGANASKVRSQMKKLKSRAAKGAGKRKKAKILGIKKKAAPAKKVAKKKAKVMGIKKKVSGKKVSGL